MPLSHHNHPEAAERATPLPRLIKHGHKWAEWPQELRDQITRIAALQTQLADLGGGGKNWSDKDFTEGRDIATIWPSLRTGTYPYPSQTKTRTKWRTELDHLEQRGKTELLRHEHAHAKELRLLSADRFIKFTEYHAISKAIDTAKAKTETRSEERLIVFKARTRGGKTWMGDQLMDDGKLNWRVDATPSWHRSYRALLVSLSDMFDLSRSKKADALTLETNLINHIKTLSGVVLFEEVQSLCHDSQEFIKLLLNKSSLVVCIFVTNEAHEEMLAHGGNHLAQLLARAAATITASRITADHVREFDPELWAKAASERQLELVADAANTLGALSAVRRITTNVRALAKQAELLTDDMITRAIKAYRRDVPVVDTTSRATRGALMGRRAA